jgi:hypothetical protein
MTSKIKVDNIENQCGGAVVTKCGATTTISGSVVKADDIQAADGGNLINQCGTTITLGASGDTINLASGASQTGFGRTGTVDWQTSSIKTATFTAANGEGYFANTSGGAFTMNLPAGTAGNIVSVVDYTNTFQTNALTIAPNGSQKIGGVAASNSLSTEGQSVTFVYVDDTEGWKNVQDSTSNVTGSEFIIATGGTVSTSGNCKIHTFTSPGTFTVSQVHPCAANNEVSYMVVAGGGGGGGRHGGGGGAGGFREDKSPVTPYTASPLEGSGPITVTATSFPITVGGGGTAGNKNPSSAGTNGANSVFSTITSAGGGRGYTYATGNPGTGGQPGGSGGGGGHTQCSGIPGGAGNTPPVSPPQGNPGGNGGANPYSGGGGGGATAAASTAPPSAGSPGGAGATTDINGSPTAFAGGGGGGNYCSAGPAGSGGTGGGGAGGGGPPGSPTAATTGTVNTGGGGGGYGGTNPGNPSPNCTGANGGSGIVIIRYKFQ